MAGARWNNNGRTRAPRLPPAMAAHGFTVVAGFLIDGPEGSARAPIGTNFVTVEAAAHECSLDPRCRGFTLSASHTGRSQAKKKGVRGEGMNE